MLVELSESEVIFLRAAAREYRTAAPEHIKSDPGRLQRWVEERELYDPERTSTDRKLTDLLASHVDQKNGRVDR